MPTPAPANAIGLTATADWNGFGGRPLTDQLDDAGIRYGTRDLPLIVGMGGCAQLVFYTSAKRGREVTVLVVPHQSDIDQCGETYYYFDLPEAEALAGDVDERWAGLYDQCRELVP